MTQFYHAVAATGVFTALIAIGVTGPLELAAVSFVIAGLCVQSNTDLSRDEDFISCGREFPLPAYAYKILPVSIWSNDYYSHDQMKALGSYILVLKDGQKFTADELCDALGINERNANLIGKYFDDMHCNFMNGLMAYEGKTTETFGGEEARLPAEFAHLFRINKLAGWNRHSLSKKTVAPGARLMNIASAYPNSNRKDHLASLAESIIVGGGGMVRDPDFQRMSRGDQIAKLRSDFITIGLPKCYSVPTPVDITMKQFLNVSFTMKELYLILGMHAMANLPVALIEKVTEGYLRKSLIDFNSRDQKGKLTGWISESESEHFDVRGQMTGTSSFRLPAVSAMNLDRLRMRISGVATQVKDSYYVNNYTNPEQPDEVVSTLHYLDGSENIYAGTILPGEQILTTAARMTLADKREKRKRDITARLEKLSSLRTFKTNLGNEEISINNLINKLSVLKNESDFYDFLRHNHTSCSDMRTKIYGRKAPAEARKVLKERLVEEVFTAIYLVKEPQTRWTEEGEVVPAHTRPLGNLPGQDGNPFMGFFNAHEETFVPTPPPIPDRYTAPPPMVYSDNYTDFAEDDTCN